MTRYFVPDGPAPVVAMGFGNGKFVIFNEVPWTENPRDIVNEINRYYVVNRFTYTLKEQFVQELRYDVRGRNIEQKPITHAKDPEGILSIDVCCHGEDNYCREVVVRHGQVVVVFLEHCTDGSIVALEPVGIKVYDFVDFIKDYRQ